MAAGVPAVGITTGQPRQVLLEAGACILIKDFFDLLAVAAEQEKSSSGSSGGSLEEAAAVEASGAAARRGAQ